MSEAAACGRGSPVQPTGWLLPLGPGAARQGSLPPWVCYSLFRGCWSIARTKPGFAPGSNEYYFPFLFAFFFFLNWLSGKLIEWMQRWLSSLSGWCGLGQPPHVRSGC